MKYSRAIFAVAIIASTTLFSFAQTGERQAAIKHYLDGNDLEAVIALEALLKKKEYSADAEAVNYLGLAYQNAGDPKGARKMFEKAVKLQPGNAAYRANLAYVYLLARQLDKSQAQAKKALEVDPSSVSARYVMGTADLWEGKVESALTTAERMIEMNKTDALGYVLKSDALVAQLGNRVSAGSNVKSEINLLRQSVETLEEGIKNTSGRPNRTGLEQKLEGMRAFYGYYSKERPEPSAGPQAPEPGVTPVRIISKPRATYTDSARSANVQGTIRVAALLGANGAVLHVLKLKGLGYGLDEHAINAARQIVFGPKMKDGVPVSTVAVFEYTFSIY
jgi:tetratricopeptide (TPR) repeat protein